MIREEGAETLIEQMTRDQDPIIRYGGMFVVALAYRGTANNAAVARLLHFAVSDVSDDVRRAAVMCLGFLLIDAPAQCPRLVSLLVCLPLLLHPLARFLDVQISPRLVSLLVGCLLLLLSLARLFEFSIVDCLLDLVCFV